MQFSQALNPRRVARIIVATLVLPLVQTIVAPILIPEISVPAAKAVTETISGSTAGGKTIIIPPGVFSITLEVVGGAGGKGGDDVNTGGAATVAGRVISTFAVKPGDVIGLYGGKKGTAGSNGAQSNGGGPAGADTFPDSTAYAIGSTYFFSMNFAGGTGGNVGSAGSSGGGGGGGGASVATINSEIVLIAGGGGGGGGTGSGTNTSRSWSGTLNPNGSNFNGTNGTNAPVGTCGGTNQNDGGGGGGGGGGYYGGQGGTSARISEECAGTAGSPGGNYRATRGTDVTNDRITRTNEDGYAKYTFSDEVISTCAKTSSTSDIYTIETINYVGNCSWTVPNNVNILDLFLVGGGGGGGGDGGGGGGGGSATSRSAIVVTPGSTLSLKVGHGGAGGSFGYSWGANSGDSSTVRLANGTLIYALGGSGGGSSPNAAGGAGGVAVNGGFAGGAGGSASTSAGTVGGVGKSGISNYFSGSLAEYGGGGGGGAYTNSAVQTPASGNANGGGGAGGYASTSSVNAPGTAGTDGKGGGGGGGVATGSGLKINGGKGGSGLILIRYATDAANEFPSSLASDIRQRWSAENFQLLDTSRYGWIDSSGTNSSARTASSTISGSGFAIETVAQGSGSSKSIRALKGGSNDWVKLANLPANSKYTLFHVAKYQSGSSGRIFASSSGDWLSGFHSGKIGVASHNVNWLTAPSSNFNASSNWQLSADQNWLFRSNGVTKNADVVSSQSVVNDFGINVLTSQPSQWQVAEVIVFDRELNVGEIRLVEEYLSRIFGITTASNDDASETDTALVLDGNDYLYAAGYTDLSIADQFTFEAWVKPSTSCQTGSYDCYIYKQRNNFGLTVFNGSLQYLLQAPTGTAVWVNVPTVKLPAAEWHHIAVVKDQPANTANSLKVYLDGILAWTTPNDPFTGTSITYSATKTVSPSGYVSYIGYSDEDTSQKFVGSLDEIKIWNSARTQVQIMAGLSNSPTLTDTNLKLYLDFNKSDLNSQKYILNRATKGTPAFDMQVASGTVSYAQIESYSATNAHTVVTFPRSIINQSGGWKAPYPDRNFSYLVVGGGGGGGTAYDNGAGGGGAGGMVRTGLFSGDVSQPIPVVVGIGGLGGPDKRESPYMFPGNSGGSSTLGNIVSLGGGAGRSSRDGSGAGGLMQIGTTTAPTGGGGGCGGCGGGGGGGAGGDGGSASGATAGIASLGLSISITGTAVTYGNGAPGGTGSISSEGVNGTYSRGSGGSGGSATSNDSGGGGNGGSGVVIVRWITAVKPTFAYPTNAYLNVGMTETFTTNVAVDSATVGLTRTFRWESTTAGSGGTYSTIKSGTGASNAAFSWVPSDTSTSGSQYLYRVIVTDSDTAGLFIQDTSTAVYAVINQALVVSGSTTIAKKINLAKSETFTITLGTPTYRATLSPVIPGISLDTSTAGIAVIKISETATVGTWAETLTVTDSVSASVNVLLSINVMAPPQLLHTSEIATNGLVLNLVAGNSGSILLNDGVRTSGSQWKDLSGNARNADTGSESETNFYTGRGCTAPTYSSNNAGYLVFDGVNNCFLAPYLGSQFNKSFSIEGWFRLDGTALNTAGVIAAQNIVGNSNISFVLGDSLENGTISVGFYNGNWKRTSSGYSPIRGEWTHYVGTYDGVNLKLYVNGTLRISTPMTESLGSTINTAGTWIGRRWDADNYLNGSLGEVRIYSIPLTETQVASNFNATKYRFKDAPASLLKPTKKYGTVVLESFTATSGYDTKTVTLSVGDRAGIDWDTSTVQNRLNLTVQESLTVGTYNDTITVTDSLGQSTYLPITFTVTKADTVTVTMGSSASVVYSGTVPAAAPRATISGLVGVDSATVQTLYTGTTSSGGTCATGGACAIGDVGPGGGYVFYISPTVINKVSGISDGGIYLEIAPYAARQGSVWSNSNAAANGTLATVGSGAANTNRIITQLGSNGVAATAAANFTYGGKSDWFLPSTDELYQAYLNLKVAGLGDLDGVNYWSSTEVSGQETSQAYNYWMGNNNNSGATTKTLGLNWRPIRAFSPTTLDTTTAPIDVDTYTAMGSNLTFTIGAASNYQAVVYETSTLRINQANQNKLTLNLYGAVAGSPFTLQISGGSGPGAVTETVTAGSTAANCRLNNKVLSNDTPATEQKSCNISITKAASRNYKEETLTATVYFMLFQGQPTGQVGSGSTIALNGQTSLTIDDTTTVQAPVITGFNNGGLLDLSAAQTLSIYGSGFSTTVTVKFWRNKLTVSLTPTSGTEIRVLASQVPSGATSGPVSVILSNGATAVSATSLTISGSYLIFNA